MMLPFAAEPLIAGQESRLTSTGSSWLQIVVRLKPGQSLEQANAALRTVQSQIVETSSVGRQRSEPLTLVSAATGNSALRRRFETPLFAMVVAVGLVRSSRAPTSPACCSRGRCHDAASSACVWRWGAHAGGSRVCSSSKAWSWPRPERRSGWYSRSGAVRSWCSS